MRWLQMHELKNTLTKVGFNDIDTSLYQIRIHFAFLGQH